MLGEMTYAGHQSKPPHVPLYLLTVNGGLFSSKREAKQNCLKGDILYINHTFKNGFNFKKIYLFIIFIFIYKLYIYNACDSMS